GAPLSPLCGGRCPKGRGGGRRKTPHPDPPPPGADRPSLFRGPKRKASRDLHRGREEPFPSRSRPMSALPMIRTWRQQVRDELLPGLHGHQAKALADLSFAMALVQHCHSGKVAAVAPGDTTPAATQRRLERLLANDRLDPETAWPQLARAVLAGWAGGPIGLILDETPHHTDF